jgi:glucose 1-dehydrogenase
MNGTMMPDDPAISPMGMFDLSGRRALVTGARRGIGRAIAQAFAVQGAHVAVHHAPAADEQSDAEAVVHEITRHGGVARRFAADFGLAGAGSSLAAQVSEALGPIDILVLNASIEILEEYDAISMEHFDRQIAINLRAPLELVQAVLPAMKHRGWGRILAIGSVQQIKPHREMLIYAGTKSAQKNWVQNLARHVGSTGVTINNLAPGAIWTARNDMRMSDPELRHQTEQRVPAGRLGKPEDLVGAALLLCSDAGSYINGVDLFVDGGMGVS